jgi:hypothetical protein
MAHTFTLTNRQQASVSRKLDFGKANVELKPFLRSEYPGAWDFCSLCGQAACLQSSGFARLDLPFDLPNRLAADDLQVVVSLHVEPVLG